MRDVDLAALIERLRATFASGRTRSLDWRREQLAALEEMLRDHEDEILDALAADLGKPPLEGWETDVGFAVAEARNLRKHLAKWTRSIPVPVPLTRRPARARRRADPLGVVLVIAPWNYPFQLLLVPLAGAIAAGNCVVAKPSSVAPASSAVIARLVPRYLDRDAVAVVEATGAEGAALLEQRFDHIFFTGSPAVGRTVMAAAARHLTPVTLELGGKNPAIVDRRADIELAARRIAWGKYLNAGQTCVAPDYVLVDRDVEQQLVERLAASIRRFYGPDPRHSSDYGRIVSTPRFRRLVELLGDGTPAIGGEFDEGERYIAPTVLRGVSPDAAIMGEEIFGPLLPLLPVNGIDEAIAFVNARPKPLALYVFSADRESWERVLAETSSGGACVNATLLQLAVPELPFGGVGESGMGSYHGRSTFETFTHRKSVLVKGRRPDPAFAYPPFTRLKERILRRFL